MPIVRRRQPTGWAIFAATVLFLVGLFYAIYGLTPLRHDQALVVSPSGGLTIWDLRVLGWTILIRGAIMIVGGRGPRIRALVKDGERPT